MSYKLSEVTFLKENFDPMNVNHVNHYKYFIENNRWNGPCPFRIEWPFVTIPDLIKDRLIKTYINAIINHVDSIQKQKAKTK